MENNSFPHKITAFHKVEPAYDIPDKMIALLVRFLEQGNGKLSKRAKEREFNMLNDQEIKNIENMYSRWRRKD